MLVALVLICIFAAARLDWQLVLKQLRKADAPSEIAMAAAWIVALCIRPLRLMVLARALAPQSRPRYAPIWSADMVAMAMNSIIPMRAGDIMMTVTLGQNLGITTARATSVVLVDRFFDFATVMVIFATTLAIIPTSVAWAHQALVVCVATLSILSLGLWITIHKRKLWMWALERLVAKISSPRVDKALAQAHDLFEDFARIDNIKTASIVVLLSMCQWTAISASYWFGVGGVWPEVTFGAAAFAAAAVALSFIVPVAPGGFGVFHGAVVLALTIFSVPVEPAIAFAIVAHVLQMGSVLIFGILSVLAQGISLRSLAAFQNAQW
jgi:uncharacterized protein (TIRG00374 family)